MSGNRTYLLNMSKDEINLLADAMKHYREFMAKRLCETIRLEYNQMYAQYKMLGEIMDLTKDVIAKCDEPIAKDNELTKLYEKDAEYKKSARVHVPGIGKGIVLQSGINANGKEVTQVKFDTGIITNILTSEIVPIIDVKNSVEE